MPKKSVREFRSIIQDFPKLIFSIAICQGAGFLGSVFTFSAITSWYSLLNKPSFGPPNWVFGPVWTILYTLMGISLYIVWRSAKKRETRSAVALFIIHLGVNTLWSILFFGLHNPLYALFDIFILWILILILIIRFWRIDKKAGFLLLPYFAWVSFATILNYSIWQLNII